MSSLEIGSIVEGVVSRVTKFGAFVELPGGKDGLIHISEVADVYVKDVLDYVKEKDRVKVKIISIDEQGKIGLSLRQANTDAPSDAGRTEKKPFAKGRGGNRSEESKWSMSFEERLAKFLKESEERQSDLKRSTEAKRGGRGGRRGNW